MNIIENIKEGLRAIYSNLLRTILTAMIVAIGITSLVGILTAISGIQSSVSKNMASLGANSFDIRIPGDRGGRRGGVADKKYPPISYKQAKMYKERTNFPATISIYTSVSFSAELKNGSNKTNPNIRVIGADDGYFNIKGFAFNEGRNFSNIELEHGANVLIIGHEIGQKLFPKQTPVGKEIMVLGKKFHIVGVLNKAGSSLGNSSIDRSVIVPVDNAGQLAAGRTLRYSITTSIDNPAKLESTMSEATGVMRVIRNDGVGKPESFEIERSESMADAMNSVTGILQIGGFGVGFITLLGAAIGLMNIMMVSVTERTQEIGIRKALGATPARIRQQFLIEALVICQLGGIAGIFFGLLIGNLLSSIISDGGFVVPWLWMFVGFIICLVVGVLSGYYPAYKASKLDPIESLRFE